MPETPDFERIVERVALRTGAFQAPVADVVAELVEQLRQVWNARGAVDISTLEVAYGADSPPSMKMLDRALRALDR